VDEGLNVAGVWLDGSARVVNTVARDGSITAMELDPAHRAVTHAPMVGCPNPYPLPMVRSLVAHTACLRLRARLMRRDVPRRRRSNSILLRLRVRTQLPRMPALIGGRRGCGGRDRSFW
jgi:hypothetical protein